jgi:ATP-binding cassette subfamily B protein
MRDLYRDLADAEEMVEILNTKYEIEDPENAKNISVVRGKIEFQKVKFSYDKSKKVIKNLNLYIKPGEKVALVGPSGGGKSTVAKLILRFFDIQRGKILVDGQNIKTVTQNSLRSQISLVPQDPILFHRTLKENIRYGCRNATDEQVIAASKLAHCHEFIQKFPEKYETYVGERGVKLSGGERQRVAIARAILANNPITILDEATSSLDSYSESKIQEALKNLMKYKTTLIIAHRLSTIMSADRILVFKDGEIVESGTHNALIKKEKGLYKKLWHLQSGGYLNS